MQRDSGGHPKTLLVLCAQIHNKPLYLGHLGVESVCWCSQTVQVKITPTTRLNYDCVSLLRAKRKKVLPSSSTWC